MSLNEVYELTFDEYDTLMRAVRLRQIDEDYRCHLNAWLTVAAGATNKHGQPIYRRFEKFYNYKKALEEAENGPQETTADKLMRYYNGRHNNTGDTVSEG